jgi:hypothetical protein
MLLFFREQFRNRIRELCFGSLISHTSQSLKQNEISLRFKVQTAVQQSDSHMWEPYFCICGAVVLLTVVDGVHEVPRDFTSAP